MEHTVDNNIDITCFNFRPVTQDKVEKLLLGMSPSKACDTDGLTARIIKACGSETVAPLTYVFNLSLQHNIFPNIWKSARVSSLYKDGDNTKPSNYRPILVLPILSKVLEHLVHDQVYTYISEAEYLSPNQAGFRKRSSISTCLIEFLDKIYDSMDNGCLSGVLFLDLRKAFDTVDHQIAISRLSKFNLHNDVLDWFRDYLGERYQICKINGVESEQLEVKCGVPQGSILGLLIFIMYINSLPEYLHDSNTYLYAGDTAILQNGTDIDTISRSLTLELERANIWLKNHKLSLNIDKTKIMYFGTTGRLANEQQQPIELDGVQIKCVDQYKYLGILWDCHLKFNKYVCYSESKIWPKIKTLARIRRYITTKISLYLYNSLIAPCFHFTDYVYDLMSLHDENKLQVIQNTCLHICLQRDKRTHRKDLFDEAEVIPLDVQRKLDACQIMNSGLNGQSMPLVINLFSRVSEVSTRVTRWSIKDKCGYLPLSATL